MNSFKNDVMYYLGKHLSEEKDTDVCPKCGKKPCVCSKASADTSSEDKEAFRTIAEFEKANPGQKAASAFKNEKGEWLFVPASNASASTKTAGGDDGDDYTKNASVSNDKDAYFGNDVPEDGYTPEERKILKCIANKIKKQQKEGIKEPADGWTPEEKEIIKLLSGKASVDDHTNGRNGCADTECDDKEKKNSLKESIMSLLK